MVHTASRVTSLWGMCTLGSPRFDSWTSWFHLKISFSEKMLCLTPCCLTEFLKEVTYQSSTLAGSHPGRTLRHTGQPLEWHGSPWGCNHRVMPYSIWTGITIPSRLTSTDSVRVWSVSMVCTAWRVGGATKGQGTRVLPHILLGTMEKEITQAWDGSVVPLASQARGPEFDPQHAVKAGTVASAWFFGDGEAETGKSLELSDWPAKPIGRLQASERPCLEYKAEGTWE